MKQTFIFILLLGRFSICHAECYWLFNKNKVTYVNNDSAAYFVVSFKGDTVIQNEDRIFQIDSSAFQINTFPITVNELPNKFNSVGEQSILTSINVSENSYAEQNYFGVHLDEKVEFFNNKYGKQFLLSYYELPTYNKDRKSNNDPNTLLVKYQATLYFIANSRVVGISRSIYDTEDFNLSLESLKSIAEEVRIYWTDIQSKVLNAQLEAREKNEKLLINLPESGLRLEIPFWLNVSDGNYDILSCFPDVRNISNALLMVLKDKSIDKSLQDFSNRILEAKTTSGLKRIKNKNKGLNCFFLKQKSSHGVFFCQYVYFETNKKYGLVSFTATKDTYAKNISRFNEFLDSIELNP